MNRFLQLTLSVLFVATSLSARPATPAGQWEGAIQLPGTSLGLIVVLGPDDAGTWKGSIEIPAQSLKGFALSGVVVAESRVHFEMAGIPGKPTFDGELSASGDEIAGTFEQSTQRFPFSLKRVASRGNSEAASSTTTAPPDSGGVGEVVGSWLGTLEAGPMKLRLALNIERRGDGLAAVLDSIDQGSKIPIDSVTFEGRKLRLTIQAIGGSYEGTLDSAGTALQGTWTQGGQSLPLTFARSETPFALNRPQLPKEPFPYSSHDVRFRSAGGIELAGTLIVPEGKGPFTAVAMATGSGPQDRDETLMGHKPFLVIADALARRGIASLRWDDRGVGGSGGDHMGSTVEDFAADVRAGVEFLRNRPEINARAIGIVGHSEGGLHGPMAAVANESIAFLVLLAPPGESMKRLLVRQGRDLLRLRNVDPELIERAMASQDEDLRLIADASIPTEELRTKLRARAEAQSDRFSAEERRLLQVDSAAMERGIQISTTPWFRSLMRQNPADYLHRVTIPVLALFGEKDFQVDARVNAEAVRKALTAAGNADYDVRILPGLNHLFQHAGTGGMEEYGTIEETFAPSALEAVGQWIEGRFPRSAERK